jgi:hypothetical protein
MTQPAPALDRCTGCYVAGLDVSVAGWNSRHRGAVHLGRLLRWPSPTADVGNQTRRAAAVISPGNRDIDGAERSGHRSSKITLAILLAGLALSISALAATARTRGINILDGIAGLLLLSAVVVAARWCSSELKAAAR